MNCSVIRKLKEAGLTLERRQLDLEAGTLRLDHDTKKGDARVVSLKTELKALLTAQLGRVEALHPSGAPERVAIKVTGRPADAARRLDGHNSGHSVVREVDGASVSS